MAQLKLIYEDGKTYKLLEPVTYNFGDDDARLIINIPEGFETDFASVPKLFWNILPPTGKHGEASLIHDILYRKRCKFSRIMADTIFFDVMRKSGVPLWQRCIMYVGVRLFGWLSYHKKK